MAKAESRSITRRALVAGSAALPVALAAGSSPAVSAAPDVACAAAAASAEALSGLQSGATGPGFRSAPRGLQADPVHAAIAAHARAYAACAAYQQAEPDDEVGLEPLLEAEREAGEELAATIPATLAGAAAVFAHVHALHARDNYPMLDDYGCYVLIASADTALRRIVAQAPPPYPPPQAAEG